MLQTIFKVNKTAQIIYRSMLLHRINITVLQGSTVIKKTEHIKIINTLTNPNEAKRLSEMSIGELEQYALQQAINLIAKI